MLIESSSFVLQRDYVLLRKSVLLGIFLCSSIVPLRFSGGDAGHSLCPNLELGHASR